MHRFRTIGLPLAAALASLSLAGCASTPPTALAHDPVAARYLTAADRYVSIDGVRVRVRDEGPRGAPPILLIHGFSYSLESWDAWAADLARDHRVIRYDLTGHGLSDPDPQARYGTTERVVTLIKLMDSLGLRRATIAGNSFGGLIAWNLAAIQPERVDRLILVDSAAYSINGVTEKPVAVPAPVRAYLLAPTPQGTAYMASQVFADPAKLTPERLATMHALIARPGVGRALVAHLERFTLPEPDAQLARIAAPTLILWGRADKVVPVEQADRLHAAIKGSELIIYDGVGHAPQEEAPERSLADLRRFLAAQK